MLAYKRSKREETIHKKLCENLALHLNIDSSELLNPDFFLSKCQLANMQYY